MNAIVVTCIGNLGKVGITTKISATNQQINSFICNENLNFKFLYYQICTLKPWLENESSATTIAIVNKGKFSKAPISIPSLAEQKIIADKLDTLLAQVDSTRARLEQIPQTLKRFRQTVLAAAVSGKLTEEWRVSNGLKYWETQKIGNIVSQIESGKSLKCLETPPQEHEYGIVKISAVTWGNIMRMKVKHCQIKKISLKLAELMMETSLFLELILLSYLVRQSLYIKQQKI